MFLATSANVVRATALVNFVALELEAVVLGMRETLSVLYGLVVMQSIRQSASKPSAALSLQFAPHLRFEIPA